MAIVRLNSIDVPPASTGDALLAPLRWCGTKWNSLGVQENSKGIEKISQIARDIICGVLLLVPTVIAFVPGVVGALIKPSQFHVEHWTVEVDGSLKERCKQMGMDNTEVEESEISHKVIEHMQKLPDCYLSSVSVRKFSSTNRCISLHREEPNGFFRNLSECFRPITSPIEEGLAMGRLVDAILGLKRMPSGREDNTALVKKISLCSKIYVKITQNLEHMDIQVFR